MNILAKVQVAGGSSSNFMEETLTQDIGLTEAFYDLIDNSLDAARNDLMSKNSGKYLKDEYNLPADYSGYEIDIRLGKNSIIVKDNCYGIDKRTLEERAFVAGTKSKHPYGIGHYGLGLKRSLLKFGTQYSILSDNGIFAFKMRFDNEKMTQGNLSADIFESKQQKKTLIVVNSLHEETIGELSNSILFESFVDKLSIRYAIYVAKGIKIKISNSIHKRKIILNKNLPNIRKDCKFNPTHEQHNINNVDVYIESGVHERYYFSSEIEHSGSENRKLTEEFGLYFICNDRVIVSASLGNEYGWQTKWHSEYGGFICFVRFGSEDSGKIPWNTVKTALNTNSMMFLEIKDRIQPIASQYRNTIKILYPSSLKGKNLKDASTKNRENSTKSGDKFSSKNNQNKHWNKCCTLLPENFPICENSDILTSLIIEATRLEIGQAPFTASLLLRALLEGSMKNFVKRSDSIKQIKEWYKGKQEKDGKSVSNDVMNNNSLSLDIILTWLNINSNSNIFDKENTAALRQSLKHAGKHKGKLNGIVHGDEIISKEDVVIIRNEVYYAILGAVNFSNNGIKYSDKKKNNQSKT